MSIYGKTIYEKFIKDSVINLCQKFGSDSHIEQIKLSWENATYFMEALKEDPSFNYEYYESLFSDKKVKEELWKPFYNMYQEHLRKEGKEKDFDAGFLFGIPIMFSNTVPNGAFTVIFKKGK